MSTSSLQALVAQGYTHQQIAEHLGLTRHQVRRRLKQEGLSTSATGRPRKLSKAQTIRLIRKACAEELTQAQIAEEAGITDRTLRNTMARYGLEWSDQT